jgi:hypothetical protein
MRGRPKKNWSRTVEEEYGKFWDVMRIDAQNGIH